MVRTGSECRVLRNPTPPSNVFSFLQPWRRPESASTSLIDLVYASGTLTVAADDRETKRAAARLQLFGFVTIDEVGGGRARRLRPSEAAACSPAHPWRVSKTLIGFGQRAEARL
jgi:hypothetical protein